MAEITADSTMYDLLKAKPESSEGFFAFMGVANLFVAFNFSTDDWVNFKLFGSMGLMLVFVIGQSMMLDRYLDKEDNQ